MSFKSILFIGICAVLAAVLYSSAPILTLIFGGFAVAVLVGNLLILRSLRREEQEETAEEEEDKEQQSNGT